MTDRGTPRRWAVFLLGIVLLGAGVALVVAADTGVSSWQLLEVGLVETTGRGFGVVVVGESLVALAVAWLWLREPPGPGTLVIAVTLGPLIELALGVLAQPATLPGQLAMVTVGTVVLGSGLGLYIAADVGPSAQDAIFTGLLRHHGMRPAVAKVLIDGTLGLVGWLLGGPLGLGTVLLTFALPPIVERMLAVGNRLAGTVPLHEQHA